MVLPRRIDPYGRGGAVWSFPAELIHLEGVVQCGEVFTALAALEETCGCFGVAGLWNYGISYSFDKIFHGNTAEPAYSYIVYNRFSAIAEITLIFSLLYYCY